MYEIDHRKCIKVGDCLAACPTMVIEKKDDGTMKVGEDCTDCGACEPVCDAKAIQRVQ